MAKGAMPRKHFVVRPGRLPPDPRSVRQPANSANQAHNVRRCSPPLRHSILDTNLSLLRVFFQDSVTATPLSNRTQTEMRPSAVSQ